MKLSRFAFFRILFLLASVLPSFSVLADEYAEVQRLIRSQQFKQALNQADLYLANKPRDPQMRFLKGVIQTDSGLPEQAMNTFTALIQDYPELPEPYNNLAALHAQKNQFEQARAALEMAIRTNPNYAIAHENLGDVLAQLASQSYARAQELQANPKLPAKLQLLRELLNSGEKK
ncbi:MAG: tetratricopeptide repeat protein [Burkholderiaceae bacterium]